MSFEATGHPRWKSVSPHVRQGVKALASTDERILLVKERHTDGTPFWTLPGGGRHPGESQPAALTREIREELDCHVVLGDVVETVLYAHHSQQARVSAYTVVECTLGPSITPNRAEGICEARWVSPDALPPRTLPQFQSLLTDSLICDGHGDED